MAALLDGWREGRVAGKQQTQPTPLDVSEESEFLQAVKGRDSSQVWAIMDDLMDTVRVTAPRAYRSVMERIRAIQ